MQRGAVRRQAELCHEKRPKAMGRLARKGEMHVDTGTTGVGMGGEEINSVLGLGQSQA